MREIALYLKLSKTTVSTYLHRTLGSGLSQKLPDWIEAQVRAWKFFGWVPKADRIHANA